jgi:hypothetical protein
MAMDCKICARQDNRGKGKVIHATGRIRTCDVTVCVAQKKYVP